MGLYDNEAGCYVENKDLEQGLWVEDADGNLWIIPKGEAETEGPDDIKFKDGPRKGQWVYDVINKHDPNHDELESLGLTVIPNILKRFTPETGYYHA